MRQSEMTPVEDNWKPKILMIGTVLGALVGVGAAYLLIQKAEGRQDRVNVGASDAVKLGVLVFGLLRSVSQLGGGE